MPINCDFFLDFNVYICFIYNQKIPSILTEDDITGRHYGQRDNDDVEMLQMQYCDFASFPTIGEVFENLKRISITQSNLKEISKENLKQFKNLEEFCVQANEFEFLPGDLFEHNKKLKTILFDNNKIKFIGAEIFDGLENLEYASFQRNEAIDCKFDVRDGNSMTLEELKKEIKEKCEGK